MMDNKTDNSESYGTIRWVLDNGDIGFFFIVAPALQQRKIADMYMSPHVAVYDYAGDDSPYNYQKLSAWADEQTDKNVFFILNMDVAFPREEIKEENEEENKAERENYIGALNMSRDMLTDKDKIWFFYMTQDLANRISGYALDFYSYVRLKIYFQSEQEEAFDGQHIMDFNDRHNVKKIKETISRYKKIKEKYMAMTFEENSEQELLSAAITLNNIALLYSDCAEYDNSIVLIKKIIKIRENVLGKSHPDTAYAYNSMGYVYEKKRRYDNAIKWYKKAIAIYKKIFGDEHIETAVIYNNIAMSYCNLKDYGSSLILLKKALNIQEKTLGSEHASTATTYNNIATVYSNLKDFNNALVWQKKTIQVYEKTLGIEHPSTACAYNNVAVDYYGMGRYEDAIAWSKKALAVREKLLGSVHLDTSDTYNVLACVYHKQGNFKKALLLFKKVYEIRRLNLGEDHPDTICVMKNIDKLSNM